MHCEGNVFLDMKKKLEYITVNEDLVEDVVKKFGVTELVATILVNRGIYKEEDVNIFLNPTRNNFYDPMTLPDIEKAILKSDLGLNPVNDGNIIRLSVPALTEERRRDLVKQVKKEAEEAKVAIRNVRRDGNDDLKKLEKNGEITEDALRGYSDDVQKMTDEHIAKIDQLAKEKEKEIMEV